MKAVIVNNEIIVLDNVRKVTKYVYEAYTGKGGVTTYLLHIYYNGNDKYDCVHCGTKETGKAICEAAFSEIYNTLSKD